ncbi:polysaccharide deacetylase family protein [Pseudoalteromonas luteoviolacea]|uniref:Putative xylanase/chitin deacetylase n=1 Tax=Pseudoalteromonas luteoviolacea (strain 2ta16) TaxID=1353533 RepID=V4HVL9_PSEL2|nr:polysaccharide deacetylase family protein [Pseudoalteromonas luteoviolacea]ESP91999.1 putative xylanase/chitin deacetylase [Pseudoalteromonas luteoviolacea 2ta16]KZN29106.1 hypothetical protein N483_06655 [Pseudoalteromonas luteoviolacea NCIMB 1944]
MKFKMSALSLGVFIGISSIAHASVYDSGIESVELPADAKMTTTQTNNYDYSDNQPWSQMPPAQLRPVQVPLFISIGFDDNGSKAGMDWIVNLTRQLQNDNGSNNAATFDGAPVRFTFFNTPSYIEAAANDAVGVKHAWRNAWLDGHEIGNHTWSHKDGGPDTGNFSEAQWAQELGITQTWLSKPYDATEIMHGANDAAGPGIPVSEIIGFRTPYLNHNNALFSALIKGNFVYDTSVEEGWGSQYNGTNNPWPYTMNNGTPTTRVGKPDVGNFPGLWQLPSNVFEKPQGGKMVAFDTNMWVGSAMSKNDVLAILKHNLHLRLEGNRSPLLYGAHANIYAPEYDTGGRATTYLERQQAIEEFIQYALSLKVNGQPVVRIVPFKDIVEWMRNPTPLTDGKVVTVKSIGASPTYAPGSIYQKGDQVYHDGKYYEAKWYADSIPGALSPDYDPWKLITREQATKVSHLGSVTPTGDTFGDILIAPNKDQTFFFNAAAGAQVKSVTLNGVNLGSLEQYTFSNLTANQTLTVEFSKK